MYCSALHILEAITRDSHTLKEAILQSVAILVAAARLPRNKPPGGCRRPVFHVSILLSGPSSKGLVEELRRGLPNDAPTAWEDSLYDELSTRNGHGSPEHVPTT